MSRLMRHFSLWPLIWAMSGCFSLIAFSSFRAIALNPDVSWRKEETPQNAYSKRQYKLRNPSQVNYEKVSMVPLYNQDDA